MESNPATKQTAPQSQPSYSGAALAWLQAIPASPDLADPFSLDEEDFAIRCIREIVSNNPFDLGLKAPHEANRKLHHLYFESRNREKVFGTKNLGIGYPFILAELGGHELAAPLFIRQVQLEPHEKNPDQWKFQHTNQNLIFPNYPLFHLLDFHSKSNFSEKARQMAESKNLDATALQSFAEEIRKKLELTEDGLSLSVQPFPTMPELPALIQEGRLRWSALAGIYPTLPKTTITEAPILSGNLPAELDWRHPFTQLSLDPSQREALQAIHRNALTAIEGASGTGKTYLLAATAINALSNGKKCLVVSKSLSALRRAQKFIVDSGFGDVSFVLRDIHTDKLMLADMLRMAADNKAKPSFDEEKYKTRLYKVHRKERQLDEAWETLHNPILGAMDFSEVTGSFLQANRMEGKELLLSQLHPADFEFTREEYELILKAIEESEPKFHEFPTLQHPLQQLNDDIFTDKNVEEGKKYTEKLVGKLLDKSTAIHHRYILKTNDYSEALQEHYEEHFFELDRLARSIREGLEDGRQRFGSDFDKSTSMVEKLYGVFSDHYKQIVQAKESIGIHYQELRKAYRSRKYFDFDFPQSLDTRNIKKVAELNKDFEASLRLWRKRIPALVREDLRRLNANSIHSELDFREQVKELEYAMDLFLEEFNDTKLYREPVKHEMLTIPKRQEFLEELIENLEETRFYLRDFPDFYAWQKHWLDLSPAAQKVVRALCKIKPKDWNAAFNSWYLHHFLQTEYSPVMQWAEEDLHTYYEELREFRLVLPEQIGALWQTRKNKALRALKGAKGSAYKTWFGKNNRALSANENIEALFQNNIQALTETLPVLLVTPQVALDVVNLSNMLFDLVLIDEAHNIPKQECYHLFDMGKNIVVFGDAKQDMTPQAEDDLLEYIKGIGAPIVNLRYQHQDTPKQWLMFNQIAFNTPARNLPRLKSPQNNTVVANVEGRYDEKTKTNEAEARQIIDWLNLIEQTPAKTYPAVAIACSTVEQRNLIAAQLLQIRQKKMPGHEKIHQLFLNGLGVYQFAELQGQHVDILMLSITHGQIDSQGHLTNDLHFWNTELGLNQLHVALTRATQRLFMAHSIPPGLHTVLAADRSHLGTCILSHLASFAEQMQIGDIQAADIQLNKMKDLLQYKDYKYELSPFVKEILSELEPICDENEIRKHEDVLGLQTPVYIKPNDTERSNSILLFDGTHSFNEQPSFEWEVKVRHFLANNNITPVPVLAAQWWRSPKQELRKLTNAIMKREEDPVASVEETEESTSEEKN